MTDCKARAMCRTLVLNVLFIYQLLEIVSVERNIVCLALVALLIFT